MRIKVISTIYYQLDKSTEILNIEQYTIMALLTY